MVLTRTRSRLLQIAIEHAQHRTAAQRQQHTEIAASSWQAWLPGRLQSALAHRRRAKTAPSPLVAGTISPLRSVPGHIARPDYVLHPKTKSTGVAKEPEIHDEEGMARMRAVGSLARLTLQHVGAHVAPGVTPEALDALAHDYIICHGAYPSPLLYDGFPKSICTSVNEVICHGVPDDRPLRDGDIINIDVTAYLDGYHGDTNATFYVGTPTAHALELVEVTRTALQAAISICGPDVPFAQIGHVIQQLADRAGMSIVRELLGHGIGRRFHAAPVVRHHRNMRPGVMIPGQTFTIEPILTLGSRQHRCWPDGWTLVTVDDSLAAQFEHTLLVTGEGVEVLTEVKDGEVGSQTG